MLVTVACVLVLIVAGVMLLSIFLFPDTSSDSDPGKTGLETKNNLVLALVIFLILGTFGTIAYYYTTLGFGSGK